MFCTSLRFCFKLHLKVQKVLMRWSNSPEIGLSSSFGHLFTPIEFFSPLTSAKHKVHLVEKSSYTHPFYHQVIFNKAMRTTINFYLVNLTVADLMVTAWGPFHRCFVNIQANIFRERQTGHLTFGRLLTRVLFAA